MDPATAPRRGIQSGCYPMLLFLAEVKLPLSLSASGAPTPPPNSSTTHISCRPECGSSEIYSVTSPVVYDTNIVFCTLHLQLNY